MAYWWNLPAPSMQWNAPSNCRAAWARPTPDLPEDRRIVLRIGINLGDVIVEGGDLYGDGVNIAARVEALTEPGGIFITGAAYDQTKNKVKARFEDVGSRTVKNLRDPIRVYRVAIHEPPRGRSNSHATTISYLRIRQSPCCRSKICAGTRQPPDLPTA
jgi:Adenylate cyclase, family 3 (some proteins contain HAMP domain)